MAATNTSKNNGGNTKSISKNSQPSPRRVVNTPGTKNSQTSSSPPSSSQSSGSCCPTWIPACFSKGSCSSTSTSTSCSSKRKGCCLFICMIGKLLIILAISIGIIFLSDKTSLSIKYLQPMTLSFINLLQPFIGLSKSATTQTNINILAYCLGTFLILPIICHSLVVLVGGEALQLSNIGEQRNRLGGIIKRAAMAQQNFVEGLVLLLAAISVASRASVKEEVILCNVSLYLLWRRVYLIAYLCNLSCLRAIMFTTGLLTLIRMMVKAVAL